MDQEFQFISPNWNRKMVIYLIDSDQSFWRYDIQQNDIDQNNPVHNGTHYNDMQISGRHSEYRH